MPCHAEPRFTRQYEHIWGRGKCSCSSACCTVSSHVCAAAGFNLGRCGFAACYGQDGMACQQQQQALKLFSLHRPRPQLLLTGCSILPTISYQLPDIHAIVICRPFSCFFFFSVMIAIRCNSLSKKILQVISAGLRGIQPFECKPSCEPSCEPSCGHSQWSIAAAILLNRCSFFLCFQQCTQPHISEPPKDAVFML